MKLISFAVPCYNSAAYMNRCVDSLLKGGDKVEIILVNDGSTDDTGKIADEYKAKYPDIIKVVHKENGGHGSGIMAGLQNAEGLYYKVVDSDDWADEESLLKILELIEGFVESKSEVDLIIGNYVYEHEGTKNHTVHYHGIYPIGKIFEWKDCKRFDFTRYLIMHSSFYRTDLVRKSDLQIPLHTFYVDNVFLYTPLPYVKTLYYTDLDFYRYYIGREDQSVNEAVMIKRVDQQIRVSKIILEKHDLRPIKQQCPKLYKQMYSYASVMVLITVLFLTLDGSPEALTKLKDYWKYIKQEHPNLYGRLRYRSMAGFFAYKNIVMRKITVFIYRIVQKVYKFN